MCAHGVFGHSRSGLARSAPQPSHCHNASSSRPDPIYKFRAGDRVLQMRGLVEFFVMIDAEGIIHARSGNRRAWPPYLRREERAATDEVSKKALKLCQPGTDAAFAKPGILEFMPVMGRYRLLPNTLSREACACTSRLLPQHKFLPCLLQASVKLHYGTGRMVPKHPAYSSAAATHRILAARARQHQVSLKGVSKRARIRTA